MHRITHSVRRITAAELPTITEPGGAPRPMTEQEMLNLGLVPLGGDIYSCAVQETTDDGYTWTPAVALPGVELSRGRPKDRFRQLKPAVRAQVMKAEVERTTGAGAKRKTERITVREAEITPGDVVKKRGIVPHMWAGERDR